MSSTSPGTDGTAEFSILVVCIGNVCRSPLAERVLRMHFDSLLGDQADRVSVSSAGVRAMVDDPMDELAAVELARLGGDAGGFSSRQFVEAMVDDADLVLTATRELRSRVLEEAPGGLRRTFTLLEFAELVSGVSADSPQDLVADAGRRRAEMHIEEYDVADPIGSSAEIHKGVADAISRAASDGASAVAKSLR